MKNRNNFLIPIPKVHYRLVNMAKINTLYRFYSKGSKKELKIGTKGSKTGQRKNIYKYIQENTQGKVKWATDQPMPGGKANIQSANPPSEPKPNTSPIIARLH